MLTEELRPKSSPKEMLVCKFKNRVKRVNITYLQNLYILQRIGQGNTAEENQRGYLKGVWGVRGTFIAKQ